MLQGLNPKHILDWVGFQFTGSVVGLDEKGVAFLAEGGGHAKIIKGRAVEVPQYRFGRGLLHRQIVVGAGPVGNGLRVAAGTSGVAKVGRFGGCHRRRDKHAKHGEQNDRRARSQGCQLSRATPRDGVGSLYAGWVTEAFAQAILSARGVIAITDNPAGACKVGEHTRGDAG